MQDRIRLVVQRLEHKRKEAESNIALRREMSRVYFLSSFLGGCLFFIVLAGRKRKIGIIKCLIFGYGIDPVMKSSGALGLVNYIN
ncbi:hypothetical protein SteCoe_6266 [Stentor coeruleus]|uniref:Uncharacterized protein n=1 Tax=Stentor coeruleus TaxID=5963 RepID=A0A1R2CQB1_9CILI|nr:hypothetical protein SteCoe_6266 [Stentor coeruleus]